MSNYATKTDLKNATHVNVSSFASKANLASLKTQIDKLDIDKLTPVPNDLTKLSNVVKNDVDNKTEYNKLVKNDNDKSGLEKKISDVDKKIPDTSSLVKKTGYNSKITKIEGKIPSIGGLATSSGLAAVENKIPNVSNLVKKTDYNTKVSDIEKKITDHNHDKYITTPEFNTLAANVFNTRLAQANVITKTNFDAKLPNLVEGLLQINLNICLLKIN